MTTENSNTTTKADLFDSIALRESCLDMLEGLFKAIMNCTPEHESAFQLASCGQHMANDWSEVAENELERIQPSYKMNKISASNGSLKSEEANNDQTDYVQQQVLNILEQIGTTANSSTTVLMSLITNRQAIADSAAFAVILQQTQAQIGWLTDLATKHMTGSVNIKGDAEDWLLPPSYNDLKRATTTINQ